VKITIYAACFNQWILNKTAITIEKSRKNSGTIDFNARNAKMRKAALFQRYFAF
jgi:hypothetical protein